jgi:linoleoyl-CoA desaturase
MSHPEFEMTEIGEPHAERRRESGLPSKEGQIVPNLPARSALFGEPAPAFLRALREHAFAYLASRGRSRLGGLRLLAKGAAVLLATGVCYGMLLAQVGGGAGRWALWMAVGLGMFVLALSLAHDASHAAAVRSSRGNALLCYAYDLVGVSSWLTNWDHVGPHHLATNVLPLDVAVGDDVWPALRIHPDAPWRSWHRFQHQYFPLAYSLATLHKWLVLDFLVLWRRRKEVAALPDRYSKLAVMITFKLFVLTYVAVIPALVLRLSAWELAAGILSMQLMPGLLVALAFQVTHINDSSAFPSLDANGQLAGSWALHVLNTTTDVAPQSRLLGFLSSGLNTHVVHHLLPNVSHVHLRELTPVIAAKARELGAPYRLHLSLGAAVRSHVRALKAFGTRPSPCHVLGTSSATEASLDSLSPTPVG